MRSSRTEVKPTVKKIDLNSDLGEGFGKYKLGNDEEMMKYITSANIACGFHAGDPLIMERSVKLAIKHGVAIGAHPGFPDLMGFGRREIKVTTEEVRDYVIYQVGALLAFVRTLGGNMQHVKPHGALYNIACQDYKIAHAIARAVYDVDKELILVGLSNSQILKAGRKVGLKVASEAFADRTYMQDGSLLPRNVKGAVLDNVEQILDRALEIVEKGTITTVNGSKIEVEADTICVHSDTPKSVEITKKLKETLVRHGIKVERMSM